MLISDQVIFVLIVHQKIINSSRISRAFDFTSGTVDLLLVHFVKKQLGKIHGFEKRKDLKYISAFLIQVVTLGR
jgi:hypothetical protein